MVFRQNPTNVNNPIVFLDIRIGLESVGRLIIELLSDIVPKTAENFRCLCTGELGYSKETSTKLHYKGIRFHKVQAFFMAQAGDIVRNNGSSGESIYGPEFEDENFTIQHERGVISMANFGRKHSNNSQFFITSVECSHLDGTNVVVGLILRGFGVLMEMEKYASDDGVPLEDIVIEDCGEILPENPWNFYDNDETSDKLPPFPLDWEEQPTEINVNEICAVVNIIKDSGNYFFQLENYQKARRKYRKSLRYYEYFLMKYEDRGTFIKELEKWFISIQLNNAAASLKLKKYDEVKIACNEVLKIDSVNAKALYRRGQAEIALKNYDEAVNDLLEANKLQPKCQMILNEFSKAKQVWMEYHKLRKEALKNLFK